MQLNQCAGSSKKIMPYFMLTEVVPQVNKLSNLSGERSGVLKALTFDLNLELKPV